MMAAIFALVVLYAPVSLYALDVISTPWAVLLGLIAASVVAISENEAYEGSLVYLLPFYLAFYPLWALGFLWLLDNTGDDQEWLFIAHFAAFPVVIYARNIIARAIEHFKMMRNIRTENDAEKLKTEYIEVSYAGIISPWIKKAVLKRLAELENRKAIGTEKRARIEHHTPDDNALSSRKAKLLALANDPNASPDERIAALNKLKDL